MWNQKSLMLSLHGVQVVRLHPGEKPGETNSNEPSGCQVSWTQSRLGAWSSSGPMEL